jgi:DNA-binding NtrC family response regulator/tetratricopeptide (TPR) repeat protein
MGALGGVLAPDPGVMGPLLVADRFLATSPDEAVDLATGETVWLRSVVLKGRPEQESWLRRCAALASLWHPHLVALVDFGPVGRAGHFEAWACPHAHPGWKGRDDDTAAAICGVVSFLVSRALSPGPLRWPSVIDVGGRPAFLPTDETGLPLVAGDEAGLERCSAQVAGLLSTCSGANRCQPGFKSVAVHAPRACGASGEETRELVDRLSDVLIGGVSGRPRAIRFLVRSGPGRIVLVRNLARTARLHGYIPVASTVLGVDAPAPVRLMRWRDVLNGRHVMLLQIGDRMARTPETPLFWLSLGMSSDRPHVLLRLEEPSTAGVTVASAFGTLASKPLVVREKSTDYLTGAGYTDTRTRAITEAAASGRHARAVRLLREMEGRCARRHDEAAAAEAALALGRLLLLRGQLADACRALDDARQHFDRARLAEGAIRAAVFLGLAWTDGGRFQTSEAVLRAAGIASAQVLEPTLHEFATLALGRCLYWQDRFVEASDCLGPPRDATDAIARPEAADVAREWTRLGQVTCARERLHGALTVGAPGDETCTQWPIGAISLGVSRACLSSRIALATHDVMGAGRFAAEARERAGQSGNPSELAASCCAKASVFSALGDVSAVREQVEEGVRAARRAHAPLRALRLRIVMAEGLQRLGRNGEAGALVRRLARIDPARVPKVVGVPLERVIHSDNQRRIVHAGIIPFRSVTPAAVGRPAVPAMPARPAMVETVVDVLVVCQSSDDDAAVLRRVTSILRERVRAVSVACFGRDHDVTMVLASEGGENRGEAVARRAIEAGLAIAPTSTTSGLEAAVPVRYAGACVGAFACRWAADVPPDWPNAGAVLAAASAAIAPCVRTALDRRAMPVESPATVPGEIVGVSDAIASLRREISRAASAPFNVVIEGESGSGKELVARAIHRLGPRKHRPLCALNCAALTDDLIEAEMFGHARGAFTGAIAERKGLFEEADHGVLVLDEVGELTARAQAKLLRAIQEGEVRRVGENFSRSVDVRIVAATNRPLRPAAEAGVFRRDLLYRLEVIRIVVPPLRCRTEDIPVLAAHFWREATARVDSHSTLAPATLAALARYDWPGNVRELQNVMAALAVAVGRRGSVGPDRLPGVIAGQGAATTSQNLDHARKVFETRFVRAALAKAGGRRAQAASDLGLTRQGLAKLMARLGIE